MHNSTRSLGLTRCLTMSRLVQLHHQNVIHSMSMAMVSTGSLINSFTSSSAISSRTEVRYACTKSKNLLTRQKTSPMLYAKSTSKRSNFSLANNDSVNSDLVTMPHIPVMTEEILDVLQPQNGQTFIDMTFGGGGHTKRLFEQAPNCRVFGLDRDPVAVELARKLSQTNSNFVPLFGRFSEVLPLVAEQGVTGGSVDGILFDVGASSMQYDEADRGFSISKDGPLDMRMEGNSRPDVPSAADIVNYIEENRLYQILRVYGEEKKARLIARAIVDSRYTFGRITTTKQLAEIVASVFIGTHLQDKLNRPAHVATRTFQALRIFVNNELNELNNGLELAHFLLRPGGRCAVISFHSLEDRIAKRHFHNIDMDLKANMSVTDHHRNSARLYKKEEVEKLLEKRWLPFSKKVTVPTEEEQLNNPRSRSAKLRVAEKIRE